MFVKFRASFSQFFDKKSSCIAANQRLLHRLAAGYGLLDKLNKFACAFDRYHALIQQLATLIGAKCRTTYAGQESHMNAAHSCLRRWSPAEFCETFQALCRSADRRMKKRQTRMTANFLVTRPSHAPEGRFARKRLGVGKQDREKKEGLAFVTTGKK